MMNVRFPFWWIIQHPEVSFSTDFRLLNLFNWAYSAANSPKTVNPIMFSNWSEQSFFFNCQFDLAADCNFHTFESFFKLSVCCALVPCSVIYVRIVLWYMCWAWSCEKWRSDTNLWQSLMRIFTFNAHLHQHQCAVRCYCTEIERYL